MPKEVLQINGFTSGTISTPSDTDVPDDAATFSMNIDPVAEDGKLMSVEQDLGFNGQWVDGTDGTVLDTMNIHTMAMVSPEKTNDLFYYKNFYNDSQSSPGQEGIQPTGKVGIIKDILNNPILEEASDVLPVSDK